MKINKLKMLFIAICFLGSSLWSETQCMDEQRRNDESIGNNQQELFEYPQKLTSIEVRNLDDSITDDSVNLHSRHVPMGIMESLGGNTVCSLSCISGATLGSVGGLSYLYFHLGFETTNGALAYLIAPFSTGIAIGSFTGCCIGYCLKKYVEREKKYI